MESIQEAMNPSPRAELEQQLKEVARGDDPDAGSRLLWGYIRKADAQITSLQSSNQTLTNDLSNLQSANVTLTEENAQLRALPASRELETMRGRAEIAERNLNLLEKAAGLSGIPVANVVSPALGPVGDERASIRSRLEKEADPRRRGELANELREWDKDHSRK